MLQFNSCFQKSFTQQPDISLVLVFKKSWVYKSTNVLRLACLFVNHIQHMMTATCFIQSTTCPEATQDSAVLLWQLWNWSLRPFKWISLCIFLDHKQNWYYRQKPLQFFTELTHQRVLMLMLKITRNFLLAFEFFDLDFARLLNWACFWAEQGIWLNIWGFLCISFFMMKFCDICENSSTSQACRKNLKIIFTSTSQPYLTFIRYTTLITY